MEEYKFITSIKRNIRTATTVNIIMNTSVILHFKDIEEGYDFFDELYEEFYAPIQLEIREDEALVGTTVDVIKKYLRSVNSPHSDSPM